MKVSLLFLIFISAVILMMPAYSQDNYSIYLVRHAEKESNKDNPSLTACGQLRAKELAILLKNADIQEIYSTQYQRTLQTAKPLSQQQKLPIKHYTPSHLDQFALHLKENQQNTLVVGHSNTTPELAQLLSNQKVAALSEKQYQHLYQIQFVGKEKVLTLLNQPLTCN